jgi:hypothetical protein
MGGEVRSLREGLPKQAVRVLVRSSLPGTLGVREVELDAGGDGELEVL